MSKLRISPTRTDFPAQLLISETHSRLIGGFALAIPVPLETSTNDLDPLTDGKKTFGAWFPILFIFLFTGALAARGCFSQLADSFFPLQVISFGPFTTASTASFPCTFAYLPKVPFPNMVCIWVVLSTTHGWSKYAFRSDQLVMEFDRARMGNERESNFKVMTPTSVHLR
ncbi:hypothetical protein LXL04_012135 [Taraxacum kok-saghyz]